LEETTEEGTVQFGKSVHRCSMIKKYHTPSFFSPTKSRRVPPPQTEVIGPGRRMSPFSNEETDEQPPLSGSVHGPPKPPTTI